MTRIAESNPVAPRVRRTRPRRPALRLRTAAIAGSALLTLSVTVPAVAAQASASVPAGSAAADSRSGDTGAGRAQVPQTIELSGSLVAGDLGFQPEGLVVRGTTAYAGSLVDGTIVTADLRTGQVRRLVVPDGDPAVGLELSGRLLLVAGGPSGEFRVYDSRTGATVKVLQLGGGFLNDVAVQAGVAYITDSQSSTLYAVPLSGPHAFQPRTITLGGDFQLAAGLNANGIVSAGHGTLIIDQTTDPDGTGSALYAVDARTGIARRISLRGGDVANSDGLILRGRTLYVVQNRSNSIAVVRLSGDLRRGTLSGVLTDPDLQVPTTADLALGALYTVNARFGTPPSDAVRYDIVRVELPRHR